jgi:predicted dehydrogenase
MLALVNRTRAERGHLEALRAGLIGCGFIGRQHALDARADGRVSIVTCTDFVAERARELAHEFDIKVTPTSADQLLTDDSLDLVIIATRHDSHVPLLLEAVSRGRHVLVEKPLGLSAEVCRRAVEAIERTELRCAVNYKFRLSSAVADVRAAVPQPKLLFAQLAMGRIGDDAPGAWIFDPVQGGGLVHATGTHLLDLLLWLSDSEPVRVCASARLRTSGAMTDDAVVGWIEFASGAIAGFSMADAGENAHPSKWMIEAFDGTAAAVIHDHFASREISGRNPRPSNSPLPPSMLSSLVDAVLTGSQVHASARDGLRATALAEALMQSAQTRQAVSMEKSWP